MSHISSVINASPASILKAHRIVNAHARLRLRSQARTGPVEGKAWAVVDALYATLGPLILRDATIFAEHRLGIKDMEMKAKKRKDGTEYLTTPSVPTIKEEDIIAALKQYECFPVQLDTKGGMSSTRKRQREEEEEEDEEEEKNEEDQRVEKTKKQKLAPKKEKEAVAAEEEAKAKAKVQHTEKKQAAAAAASADDEEKEKEEEKGEENEEEEEEEEAPAKATAEAEDSD